MTQAVLKPPTQMTQVQHFERACFQLKDKYRRTDDLTRAAFAEWQRTGGENELQGIAAEKFPASEYVLVANIPIFAEHETTDQRGNRQRYGRRELEAIAARCNERILDTGDFAPLTDGHTPTDDMAAKGAKMPEVLGYAGPFRVGKIGNRRPRWAIFADERYHKDDVEKARKLPRRSPEVWLEESMENRILDPIAMLGAETPRLDLGLARFRRAGDGRFVERYSATFAAGSNTFIPGGHATKKQAYAAPQEPQMTTNQQPGQTITATVEDIVGAITNTKQWQWLTAKMGEDESAAEMVDAQPDESAMGANPTVDDRSMESPASPAMPVSAPPAATPPAAPPPPQTTGSQDGMASPDEEAEMDDDERRRYSAMDHSGRCGYMAARRKYKSPSGHSPMRYRKASGEMTSNPSEVIEDLQSQLRTVERYHRLEALNREYVFEVPEEMELCESMTDAQFAQHAERVVTRYRRRDDPTAIDYIETEPPQPLGMRAQQSTERYAKRASEIASQRMRRGEHITYDEAIQLAKAESR